MLAFKPLHNETSEVHFETWRVTNGDNPSIKNQLREIWGLVLQDDPSSFSDEDIFFEVGGDSITAQTLITVAETQGIFLTMKQIFLSASLEDMAETAGVMDVNKDHNMNHDSSPPKSFGLAFDGDMSFQDKIADFASRCNVTQDNITNAYPCSPMQESLMADSDGNKNLYMRQLVFKLNDGGASLDRFQKAWQATIQADPVLRTRICHLEGMARYTQVIINEEASWRLVNDSLAVFLEEDARIRMAPGDPFFRYTVVIDHNQHETWFVWTVHHALCDGVSLQETLYDVSRRFKDASPVKREPFESFIQSPAVTPDSWQEQQFWQQSLSGINPMQYPPLPRISEFQPTPTAVMERVIALTHIPGFGVTKTLLLRAAWAILLSHYTGSEDVGFGAINNGRASEVLGVARMTGPTINLVPVAMHVDPKVSIASFLSRVRLQAADMMTFEHSGISKIRKYLAKTQSTALDFQTLFVVHPMPFDEAVSSSTQTLGLQYIDEFGKKEEHPYALVLSFTLSTENAVTLKIQYDERIISTQQAHNLVHHFQVVLSQLSTAKATTLVESISPLGDYDVAQIRDWNKISPRVEQTCVHHLFQNQVLKSPNAIAVCSLKEALTYSHVDAYSSSLAIQLIELGVYHGDFVGVCFEKSIWTVVSILAVFKAGGIYVPIDPAHPRGRIQEVIQRVQIKTAISSRSSADVLEGLCANVISIHERPVPRAWVETPSRSLPSSTAYLLFTSGTTGTPKGILMSHSAICTSIIHHGAAFGAGPHWRTFQFCAHTFDISITEFLTTLAFGGCICVPSEHDRLNNLAGAITALNANTLLVVPTVANLLFPKDVPTVKMIVLGGEPVPQELLQRWADHVNLIAGYGPSETAVYCSANLKVSPDSDPAHIGRSIGGSMWLVNPENHHQLSAIGCVGEIAISGAILGNGYFGDKVTTDAAFVDAPDWLMAHDPSSPYAMLYRTGDLARYNSDGTFHIVGRRDTQVKLRGFRIELGEVENQIMAHGTAKAALVALPATGPCAQRIVAVVSFTRSDLGNHSGSDITVTREGRFVLEELERHLSLRLPEYMVPSVWVVLEKMPVSISGKIDRRSIKLWLQGMSDEIYNELIQGASTNETIEVIQGSIADRLRRIWSEVLHIPAEQIGMRASFFAHGGDSIAAIQIVSRAKEAGLPVTVRGIISSRTLENLAALVEQGPATASVQFEQPQGHQLTAETLLPYQSILQTRLRDKPYLQVEDAYPLTPVQRAIKTARAINPTIFLLSWEMEMFSLASEPISLERLAQAWRQVVRKYPILRTIFLADSTGMLPDLQVVLVDAPPEITIASASAEDIEPNFITTKTPHVDQCFLPHRAQFTRHGDRHYINVELDHRVIDGWSLKLVKTAILEAYEKEDAYDLSEPPSYKQFVAAQLPARIIADNKHWASVLRGQRPGLLSLPVGSPLDETECQPSPLKTIIYLPQIKAQAVSVFSIQNGLTPASIFDAAWAQTLSRYTHSSDVTFEYVVSGRDEDLPDVFEIVGALINVLPYHLQDVSADSSSQELAHLAHRMQEQRAQDSPHTTSNVREVLENELKVGKLFNTALNFQRRPSAVETEKWKVEDLLEKSVDPWHFEVLVRVLHITDDNSFRPSFEFDKHFFDKARMEEVAEDFWSRVQNIVS